MKHVDATSALSFQNVPFLFFMVKVFFPPKRASNMLTFAVHGHVQGESLKNSSKDTLPNMRQRNCADPEDPSMLDEAGAVETANNPLAVSAASLSTDQQIKYLLKTEGTGGQVTYRVIHVADGQVEGQADGATAVSVVAGFPAATHLATSTAEGVEGVTSEPQYYYPANVSDTAAGAMVTSIQTADSLAQQTPTGQVYVMMSPQDVLATSQQSQSGAQRGSRDDKRRAQHNEVERRRRDKINNWIVQLSKTIPDCNLDATKSAQSKSGILSKACDYIQDLRQSNSRLQEELLTADSLRMDNQLLKKELEEWKSKNQMIRNQLRHHGIMTTSMDSQ
ncbi:hypothetical protein DNTS_012849 [Danionella cerebrum]|uniref:Upstream stimulatory factor 1 n=1 Tax=Danionella cerebrum TaxID=2873325 RepID=A0A553QTB5_9TELE|nr:hypothetical protein DNTS_012849 [Danionella translucida]